MNLYLNSHYFNIRAGAFYNQPSYILPTFG